MHVHSAGETVPGLSHPHKYVFNLTVRMNGPGAVLFRNVNLFPRSWLKERNRAACS